MQDSCSHRNVSLTYYLPPVNYPKFILEPGTNIAVGERMAFACLDGISNPPVQLNLRLQRQDQTSVHLDHVSITTKVITVKDDNAVFICSFTSDYFPDGIRACSAGPLTVVQTPGDACLAMITFTIPIIVAAVAIIADIVLLWKVLKPRKIISCQNLVDGKGRH